MLAAVLALLGSLTWGTSDFLASLQSRRYSPWAVMLFGTAAAGLASLVLLVVLSPPAPSAATALVLVGGGACSAFSGLAYFHAVTFTKISVMSPILAGAAVVPVLWGLVRGEQPATLQLVGIVFTIAGIVVISRPGPSAPDDALPVTVKGVALTVLSAVLAGVMLVTFDYGAQSDPTWTVAVVRCSAAIWTGVWVAGVRPGLRVTRRAVPLLAAIGVMIVAANVFFTSATTMADLSVVAVLGWLSPAVVILWARVVLHERLRPAQWGAAAAVLAGVVCLVVA
jgi:drug/metabolite transporter (DMT)-like permease